jgi:hypothetical protein
MLDLALVLILHLALLQLLGRRLPAAPDAEAGVPTSGNGAASPSLETARHMIDRAYPTSCSDIQDDGCSPSRDL